MIDIPKLQTVINGTAFNGLTTPNEKHQRLHAPQSENGSFPAKDIPSLLTTMGFVEGALAIAPALQGFDDIDYTDANQVTAIANGMEYLISKGLANTTAKDAVLNLDADRDTRTIAEKEGVQWARLGHVEEAMNV